VISISQVMPGGDRDYFIGVTRCSGWGLGYAAGLRQQKRENSRAARGNSWQSLLSHRGSSLVLLPVICKQTAFLTNFWLRQNLYKQKLIIEYHTLK
jgi:hypothetical protein